MRTHRSFRILHLILFPVGLAVMASLSQATQDEKGGEEEPQVSGSVELPLWRDGDYTGNFDIRIWPEATVTWLEKENLRAMVRDPAIPEDQRFALKRILALQSAFPADKAR